MDRRPKHHRGVGTVQGQVTIFSPGRSNRRRAAEKGANWTNCPISGKGGTTEKCYEWTTLEAVPC